MKYITLLLVSGVIIPLCLYAGSAKIWPGITVTNALLIDNNIKHSDAPQFYFISDFAAKLIPAIKYFQPPL